MGFGKMRTFATTVAALSTVGALAQASNAATYAGNGAGGFGGPIGNSTLTVTDGGTTINFSLATAGFNGNALAIYLDTVAGGENSTANYTDNADGGRTALSGASTNGRTLAQFAPGFGADYGISVEPGNFAGIFNLTQTDGFFGFVASAGLDTTATTTLNFSVNKADVGLPATGGSFAFEASLISTTGYRSNETIGASTTIVDPTNPGTAPNAGFTGTTTFSAANTFGTAAVPEPASLTAIGGLAAVALRRRRQA